MTASPTVPFSALPLDARCYFPDQPGRLCVKTDDSGVLPCREDGTPLDARFFVVTSPDTPVVPIGDTP